MYEFRLYIVIKGVTVWVDWVTVSYLSKVPWFYVVRER